MGTVNQLEQMLRDFFQNGGNPALAIDAMQRAFIQANESAEPVRRGNPTARETFVATSWAVLDQCGDQLRNAEIDYNEHVARLKDNARVALDNIAADLSEGVRS